MAEPTTPSVAAARDEHGIASIMKAMNSRRSKRAESTEQHSAKGVPSYAAQAGLPWLDFLLS